MAFANATVWNERGKYFWGDLDAGPKHGPFDGFHAAQRACKEHHNDPLLDVFASCPQRFRIAEPPAFAGFTQEMAETYADNH